MDRGGPEVSEAGTERGADPGIQTVKGHTDCEGKDDYEDEQKNVKVNPE